jgi:hypothetical protein
VSIGSKRLMQRASLRLRGTKSDFQALEREHINIHIRVLAPSPPTTVYLGGGDTLNNRYQSSSNFLKGGFDCVLGIGFVLSTA